MYPYITLWESKIYMTWLWIIIIFLIFFWVVFYLSKRTFQNFWKFFYWLPFFTISIYIFWLLTTFILEKWWWPSSATTFFNSLSPYWYKFHFVWILLWIVLSISIFIKNLFRVESKKVWIDILFFWISFSIVPLWIFLMLWDNFLWMPTTSELLGIKALHFESQLNKFNAVYPIWLFLSISAILSIIITRLFKIIKKKTWYGILWFAILLFLSNIIFLFQQYPRYVVIWIWKTTLDIKFYLSFFVIIRCLYLFNKRVYIDKKDNTQDISNII